MNRDKERADKTRARIEVLIGCMLLLVVYLGIPLLASAEDNLTINTTSTLGNSPSSFAATVNSANQIEFGSTGEPQVIYVQQSGIVETAAKIYVANQVLGVAGAILRPTPKKTSKRNKP